MEQFFVIDWPLAVRSGDGFCMVRQWMKLLASVDDMVLRQYTSNSLVASITIHKCLEGSIEFGEDGSWEKSCLDFVKGLLLCIFLREWNIFYQVDKGACLGTAVNDKSSVIISKVSQCLNCLLLRWDRPLGHAFQFQDIHLDFLTIDDML